jgi:hypothetical protein
MTNSDPSLEKDSDQIANDISFDSVCTCTTCSHGLVRDCLKVGCTCCKGTSHSMILNGMEGFLPTTDNTH